jgi:hypothetical protein
MAQSLETEPWQLSSAAVGGVLPHIKTAISRLQADVRCANGLLDGAESLRGSLQ